MPTKNVVLLQANSRLAESLNSALSDRFTKVHIVGNASEVSSSIAWKRAEVAIIDLEVASFADVQKIASEFPRSRIICTHRLADDEMWTAALNAGAADVYRPTETAAIVHAALVNKSALSAVA